MKGREEATEVVGLALCFLRKPLFRLKLWNLFCRMWTRMPLGDRMGRYPCCTRSIYPHIFVGAFCVGRSVGRTTHSLLSGLSTTAVVGSPETSEWVQSHSRLSWVQSLSIARPGAKVRRSFHIRGTSLSSDWGWQRLGLIGSKALILESCVKRLKATAFGSIG